MFDFLWNIFSNAIFHSATSLEITALTVTQFIIHSRLTEVNNLGCVLLKVTVAAVLGTVPRFMFSMWIYGFAMSVCHSVHSLHTWSWLTGVVCCFMLINTDMLHCKHFGRFQYRCDWVKVNIKVNIIYTKTKISIKESSVSPF